MSKSERSNADLAIYSLITIVWFFFPILLGSIIAFMELGYTRSEGIFVNKTTSTLMGVFIGIRCFYVIKKTSYFDILFSFGFICLAAACSLLFIPIENHFIVFLVAQTKYYFLFIALGLGISTLRSR